MTLLVESMQDRMDDFLFIIRISDIFAHKVIIPVIDINFFLGLSGNKSL